MPRLLTLTICAVLAVQGGCVRCVVAGRSSAILESSTRMMRPRWARVWGFDSSWPREAKAAPQLLFYVDALQLGSLL